MLDTKGLEECVVRWMADRPTTALAVAVVRHGEIAWQYGCGVTSCEDGATTVTPQTVFRILSTTKLLTGTAIMRLVEQNVLNLIQPVRRWLPDFRFEQSDEADRITLRHLLSHISGLPTFRGDMMSRGPEGLERFVRDFLPSYPFLIPAGKVWLYSNAGIMLAAYIAQTVTGVPYSELMNTLVFAPLEMWRTTFDPLVAMTYPFAQALQKSSDGGLEVIHAFSQNTAWDPAGGAMSCAADLAHLALMFLSGGRYRDHQVLRPETVQLMQTPIVHTYTLQDEGYGLTFATERYRGVQLARHNGGGVASYASYFYLAPDQETGIILLSNGGPQRRLITMLFDRLFAFPVPAPSQESPEDRRVWPRFVGTYLRIYSGLIEIRADERHLLLTRNGKQFVLHQRGADRYVGKATTDTEEIGVGFVNADGDEIPMLILDDSPCQRAPTVMPDATDHIEFSRLVGSYELPDASMMSQRLFHISLDDGSLVLHLGSATYRCIPISANHFACDAGLLAFRDTAQGVALEMWQTMVAPRLDPPHR